MSLAPFNVLVAGQQYYGVYLINPTPASEHMISFQQIQVQTVPSNSICSTPGVFPQT